MRKVKIVLAAAASVALALVLWLPVGARAGTPSTRPDRPWWRSGAGVGRPLNAPTHSPGARHEFSRIECVTEPSHAKNVTLDCPDEYAFPTREPTIAVDPADPRHMVAAAIDGDFGDQSIEFSTSFDGGKTWAIGDIPHGPHTQNFDPWITFDVNRGSVLITFEYEGQGADYCVPPPEHTAQLVTVSSDGGLHWSDPVKAFEGRGCFGFTKRVVLFGAEVKMITDNNPASSHYGRTWLIGGLTDCNPCTQDSPWPIIEIHSDDGGYRWTKPRVISGPNAAYCTGPPQPPQCDFSQPWLPAFGPDGSLYVAFPNFQHEAAWEPGDFESQIMVLRSPDGGDTWSPPVHVVDLEDGIRDYDCTSGYYGCRFTGIGLCPNCADSSNYIAAAPNGTLYVVFSDNRNGLHDVDHPVSNADVFVMTSTDGGQTWTGPDVVSDAPGDQFRPSIAVNPVTGNLGILFYDRGADPEGKTMNVTLATGLPGAFTLTRVTTVPSHLSGNLWLAQTLPDCPRCVYHVGEYIGLAYGSDGAANMTWADLRRFVHVPGVGSGYTMNIDYARRDIDRRARESHVHN